MLKRMLLGALIIGAVGIAYQFVSSMIFDGEPRWSTSMFVIMVLVGVAGGFFDHRRAERKSAERRSVEALQHRDP